MSDFLTIDNTHSVGSVALVLAECFSGLLLVAGTLAFDRWIQRCSTVDFADQSDIDGSDAIIIMSLLLGPFLELILGELRVGLPFTAHATFEPGRQSDWSATSFVSNG